MSIPKLPDTHVGAAGVNASATSEHSEAVLKHTTSKRLRLMPDSSKMHWLVPAGKRNLAPESRCLEV